MDYFHLSVMPFFFGGGEGGKGWSKNNAKHGKVFKSRPVTIALEKTTK